MSKNKDQKPDLSKMDSVHLNVHLVRMLTSGEADGIYIDMEEYVIIPSKNGTPQPKINVNRIQIQAQRTRLKIMGGMDVSNMSTPQRGKIRLKVQNKPVDFNVQTTIKNEKEVLLITRADAQAPVN